MPGNPSANYGVLPVWINRPGELAAICGTPSFRHLFLRMSYTPIRLARAHLHLPEVCDADCAIAADCYQAGILFLQVSCDDRSKVL